MAGGLDMSFWIWVGVAIVVVLVVAFVREQARAASRGGDKGGDAEGRLEGRDVKRDSHEGEFWEAAAVAGDPSSVPGTATSFGKPRLGCQLEHQPPRALGVPVGAGKVRVVPTVR